PAVGLATAAVVVGAAASEVLFRGVLQRALRSVMGPWRIVVAAVFSVSLAFDTRSIGLIVGLLVGGVWWGSITERSGSVRAAVVAHVLFAIGFAIVGPLQGLSW